MPDDPRVVNRFPHLQLVYRGTSPAKFPPAHVKDKTAQANRDNRVGHSAVLTQSLSQLEAEHQKRSVEREARELPTIESGVPFVVEVTTGFNLDDLVKQFKLDVVAEDAVATDTGRHRYVLVATQAISGSELFKKVSGFSTGASGSASVAGLMEVINDPADPRRLELILSEGLLKRWPLPPNEQLTLDVSFQTRGILAGLPDRPRKNPKESKEKHNERLAVWLDEGKALLFERWDEFTIDLEAEVQSFTAAYGGKVADQWENGEVKVNGAKADFPDSISMRINMSGKGFTDLVLNHSRVFEVVEPDLVEIIDQLPDEVDDDPTPPPPPEIEPPSSEAPLVCIIDSGIQEGHRLLERAIVEDRSVCLLPQHSSDDVYDEFPGGHGTRVAGAVLYPELIPVTGSSEARCWLGNARVLDQECRLPETVYPPAMLQQVVSHFSDCKIFVHSINSKFASRRIHMSAWAAKMDELSYRNQLLFIVSAGNVPRRQSPPGKGFLDHLIDGTNHPRYLLAESARIANPAQSLQALVVGSIAHSDYEDHSLAAISKPEWPSCFSRSGFGMWDTIKPDVVELGGDFCTQKLPPPHTAVLKEEVCPLLVRSTNDGGPEVGRDLAGTSFAAPKVAALAVELQKLLPEQSTLLYKAIIINSARWPQWADQVAEPQRKARVFRMIGYGRPDWQRALHNASSRVTLITVDQQSIRAGEAAVYLVPIPTSLQSPGEVRRLRVDVTLSCAAEPRRARSSLKGYQAVWLDWIASNLRESLPRFTSRMWNDMPPPSGADNTESINWMLSDRRSTGQTVDIRRQGAVQKDWAVVSGFDLPDSFAIAVRGHRGWNGGDATATANFALVVSIEAEDPQVEVYEPVRIAVDETLVQAEATVGT
ncbi:MAG: S8 family peptidase [Rhodospirillales bacterium]|nr:S8 family peptidase [Acetobacter sp.]